MIIFLISLLGIPSLVTIKLIFFNNSSENNGAQLVPKLFEACKNGDYPLIVKHINAGRELNIQDGEKSNSLLHIAAQHGHTNILTLLLNQARIQPNLKNSRGNTPLHTACAFNQFYAVDVILEYSENLDPNIKNKYGETPLEVACARSSTKVVELLLHQQKLDRRDLEKLIKIAKSNTQHADVVLLLEELLDLKEG